MRPAAGRSGMRRGALWLGVAAALAAAGCTAGAGAPSTAAGWRWGGAWRGGRDYQHFSASGR